MAAHFLSQVAALMFSRPFVAVLNEAIVTACLFVVCVCLRLLLGLSTYTLIDK